MLMRVQEIIAVLANVLFQKSKLLFIWERKRKPNKKIWLEKLDEECMIITQNSHKHFHFYLSTFIETKNQFNCCY